MTKFVNTNQIAKGKLSEFAVCDYFKRIGYTSEIASDELDKLKIDVIADNELERIYVQVKLGQINSAEIKTLIENVTKFEELEGKCKVVGVAEDLFPSNSELYCRYLEKEYGIPIMFIHKYQIIEINL